MSTYMRYEAALFARAFFAGMFWMLFLFLLNATGNFVFRSRIFRGVTDLGFWIMTGFLCFCGIYHYNQGILRGFLLPGGICGAFLMKFLLKRLLFCIKRCRILMLKITGSGFFKKKKDFLKFKRSKRIEKVKKEKK